MAFFGSYNHINKLIKVIAGARPHVSPGRAGARETNQGQGGLRAPPATPRGALRGKAPEGLAAG